MNQDQGNVPVLEGTAKQRIREELWAVEEVAAIIGTFRSEDEDNYEYGFSGLSMRIRFGGRLVIVLVLRSKGPYYQYKIRLLFVKAVVHM